jgi:hypothetical protein
VVERLLAKEKVVGSNPIARSSIEDCRLMPAYRQSHSSFYFVSLASWPSGKARVCKTLITGSNPVDASCKKIPPSGGIFLFYLFNLFFLVLSVIEHQSPDDDDRSDHVH